jgi:hypothetical protein
MLTVKGGGIKQ